MMKDDNNPVQNMEEKEEWGDDEMTAIDLSAAFLLGRADWTTYFNQKGYTGQYPYLLYSYDDADVLNDRLMGEVNRTQMLKGHNKLQIDIFTKFTEAPDGQVVGMIWLEVSGMRTIAADLKDDLIWLFCSGATDYLLKSYSTHGREAEIKWYDMWEDIPIASLFEEKRPPKANLDQAEYIKFATLFSR